MCAGRYRIARQSQPLTSFPWAYFLRNHCPLSPSISHCRGPRAAPKTPEKTNTSSPLSLHPHTSQSSLLASPSLPPHPRSVLLSYSSTQSEAVLFFIFSPWPPLCMTQYTASQ